MFLTGDVIVILLELVHDEVYLVSFVDQDFFLFARKTSAIDFESSIFLFFARTGLL